MPDWKSNQTIAALLIISLGLTGCVNLGKGTERLPQLYVLTPIISDMGSVISGQADLSLGVGPLAFPDYLNRPQIVTRTGNSELRMAPFANWAEPLKKNIQRVLVENIATLSGTDAVYGYPWRVGYAPRYQLQLEIVQFDAKRSGDALLAVRWDWLDQTGKPMMSRKHSVLRQPVGGDSNDAVVHTMSRLLLEFSRRAVEELVTARP